MAIKAELDLIPPQYYIDKKPTIVMTKAEKKEYIRNKPLSSDIGINPFPHIGPTVPSKKRKRDDDTENDSETPRKKFQSSPDQKKQTQKMIPHERPLTEDLWDSENNVLKTPELPEMEVSEPESPGTELPYPESPIKEGAEPSNYIPETDTPPESIISRAVLNSFSAEKVKKKEKGHNT